MIESFVDLTYRGLSLGRRVKLTVVRPSSGYLEMPAPMPVGTRIAFATDDGLVVDAVVTEIREQTAGADRVPGMKIVPALAPPAASTWWQARVALTDEEPAPPPVAVAVAPMPPPVLKVPPESAAAPGPVTAPVPVILRPRADTLVQDAPEEAPEASQEDGVPTGLDASESAEEDEPEIRISGQSIPHRIEPDALNSKRTVVMAAVDQELLKQLTQTPGEIEKLVERTGDHPVIDDGKRTIVMQAMDPSALGLDSGSSGSLLAVDGDDDDKSKPSGRKRRSKKR